MDPSETTPLASTSAASSSSQFQQPRQQQQSSTGSDFFQYYINPKHVVDEDYYSIDSILATTANIACTFEQETPLGLFPLIGQKAPESISERGHRTVIPAWMLNAEIDNICQFSIPSAYNKVNREVISAGAKTGKLEATRLVARQRHFYTLGRFICRHVNSEQRRLIGEELLDAFSQRIGPIITRAVDINSKPNDLLDEEEKKIFQAIQKTERRHREWTRREHRPEDKMERRSTKRKYGGGI